MGRRGPPPEPTVLKLAKGNPGGRPLNPSEVIPPAGEPEMPSHLEERAADVWKQVVPRLAKLGLARTIDGEALGRYCSLVVMWRDLVVFLDKHGRSYPIRAEPKGKEKQGRVIRFAPFPEVGMLMRTSRELIAIEDRFGLSPSARSRIQVTAEKEAKGDASNLRAKFFQAPPASGRA